jgi:hypothetical protein
MKASQETEKKGENVPCAVVVRAFGTEWPLDKPRLAVRRGASLCGKNRI